MHRRRAEFPDVNVLLVKQLKILAGVASVPSADPKYRQNLASLILSDVFNRVNEDTEWKRALNQKYANLEKVEEVKLKDSWTYMASGFLGV